MQPSGGNVHVAVPEALRTPFTGNREPATAPGPFSSQRRKDAQAATAHVFATPSRHG
jgi:hypothetical protein